MKGMKSQSPSPAVSRQWIREGSLCRENVGSMTLWTQVLTLGMQRNELLLTGRDLLSGQIFEQWSQLRVKGRFQLVWAEEMWRPPRSRLLSEEAHLKWSSWGHGEVLGTNPKLGGGKHQDNLRGMEPSP